MIQRKQTIFLLLSAICLVVYVILGVSVPYLWILCAVMATGSLANVFLYKRRPLQASICLLLILLGVIFYVAVGVCQHSLGGSLAITWPMALPAVAIVSWFMARQGIIKDEKLVRSLDRIR